MEEMAEGVVEVYPLGLPKYQTFRFFVPFNAVITLAEESLFLLVQAALFDGPVPRRFIMS